MVVCSKLCIRNDFQLACRAARGCRAPAGLLLISAWAPGGDPPAPYAFLSWANDRSACYL